MSGRILGLRLSRNLNFFLKTMSSLATKQATKTEAVNAQQSMVLIKNMVRFILLPVMDTKSINFGH